MFPGTWWMHKGNELLGNNGQTSLLFETRRQYTHTQNNDLYLPKIHFCIRWTGWVLCSPWKDGQVSFDLGFYYSKYWSKKHLAQKKISLMQWLAEKKLPFRQERLSYGNKLFCCCWIYCFFSQTWKIQCLLFVVREEKVIQGRDRNDSDDT